MSNSDSDDISFHNYFRDDAEMIIPSSYAEIPVFFVATTDDPATRLVIPVHNYEHDAHHMKKRLAKALLLKEEEFGEFYDLIPQQLSADEEQKHETGTPARVAKVLQSKEDFMKIKPGKVIQIQTNYPDHFAVRNNYVARVIESNSKLKLTERDIRFFSTTQYIDNRVLVPVNMRKVVTEEDLKEFLAKLLLIPSQSIIGFYVFDDNSKLTFQTLATIKNATPNATFCLKLAPPDLMGRLNKHAFIASSQMYFKLAAARSSFKYRYCCVPFLPDI